MTLKFTEQTDFTVLAEWLDPEAVHQLTDRRFDLAAERFAGWDFATGRALSLRRTPKRTCNDLTALLAEVYRCTEPRGWGSVTAAPLTAGPGAEMPTRQADCAMVTSQ